MNKAFPFLFLSLFSSSLLAIECSQSNVTLRNQQEVDEFQETYGGGGTCDTISADLQIFGSEDVTNLDGLSALKHIDGSLVLFSNQALENMDGLGGLESVGNSITITANPVLPDVDALAKLGSVNDSVVIADNAALHDISGLSAFESVGGSLELERVPITDLSSLSNLISVGGDLRIVQTSIRNLAGLGSLSSTGSLTLRANDLLEDIDALTSLTQINSAISIYDNPQLPDLDGLSSLEEFSGRLGISGNDSLQDIEALSSIHSLGSLAISSNPLLTHLDGLRSLNEVTGSFLLAKNENLVDVDDLSALVEVGHFEIFESALSNLDGLSSLRIVEGLFRIRENDELIDISGLDALERVFGSLVIEANSRLQSLDGLSALEYVGYDFVLSDNASLSGCGSVIELLDAIDHGEPGPGPGPAGIPDVGHDLTMAGNGTGCNSVNEVLAAAPLVEINSGIADAWFNAHTDGQGFLITVYPDIQQLFLAWFTYDSERPADDVEAILGEPGHRWLTAQGSYEGNTAVLDVFATSGGVFGVPSPLPVTGQVGTMELEFSTCDSGNVSYDIPSIGRQGSLAIQRIVLDKVGLCHTLQNRVAEEVTLPIGQGTSLTLVKVPAGTFLMGSPDGERGNVLDNEQQHPVTLTRDYFLGKTEVTEEQWHLVTGTQAPCAEIYSNYPIHCVSWDDVAGPGGFIDELNQLFGTSRFRLPTEAEWERAARADTGSRFAHGDALECSDDCEFCEAHDQHMWWCGNSMFLTCLEYDPANPLNCLEFGRVWSKRPVGWKRANPFGLQDMHGSVSEYVNDYYGESTPEPAVDPMGPLEGTERVVRGGAEGGEARFARSAARNGIDPDVSLENGLVFGTGFRVAITSLESLGFHINAGISDAWYDPESDGQGFFITVYPETNQVFVAWFTYDTERPPDDVEAILGDPGHRWLTAQGTYDGTSANLTIYNTVGGVFDSAEPVPFTGPDGYGSMTLQFEDCLSGQASYEIPSLGISGSIPIERIAPDNVPLCQSLGVQ